MNKRGFTTNIPAMIKTIVIFFITIVGLRVIYPIIKVAFDLDWSNSLSKAFLVVGVFLVIIYFAVVVIYNTLFDKGGKNE